MSGSNFVDYVKVCCRSGKGGAGSVHLHRDKNTAMGGPDGGNGGRGGNIILRGNAQLWTLLHLKYRKHIIAEPGENGGSALKTGADGKDEVLEVPLGTVARDAETNEILFEISTDGEERVLLPGGRGGMGNAFFKSSTQQTPRFAQPGEPGQEVWKILELKLLADVGLVGFPNAGKSTLLSVVSAAKPEIADYAFTTLVPNLGIVYYRDNRSFVMADIPGIIEGAHLGKGLGIRFLRHIERNSVLLFMIPADTKDIAKEYQILLNELKEYNPELMDKRRALAITKSDMLDDELLEAIKKEVPKEVPSLFISSVAQKGIMELKDLLWSLLTTIKMLQWLDDIDTQVFLFLNGKHNAFLDFMMFWVSSKVIWIAFYAWLLYLLLKKYNKGIPVSILFIVLLITISDKTASGIIKPLAQRLRPCHNILIENLVHINGNCGGEYGFVSSHAANSFAIATFVIVLLNKDYPRLKWLMLLWASLISYSRIYNGVHYPGDVICGGIVGAVAGILVAMVLKRYYHKKYIG